MENCDSDTLLEQLSISQADQRYAQTDLCSEQQNNEVGDGACRNRTLEGLSDSQNTGSGTDQSYFSQINDSLMQSFTSIDSTKSVVSQLLIRPDVSDQLAKCIRKGLKHQEPLTSIESSLKIMNEVPGARYQLPETKYKIRQTIHPGFDIDLHYKCQRCGLYTGVPKSLVNKIQLNCPHCECNILKTADNFFVYIPIKQQLVESIRKNWTSILCFKQRKRDENFISDIHDGHIVKEIDTKFPNSFNLSLTLNTDGAQVFKSSKKSLWPIQLLQNYLHPRMRYISTNIIVVGLYFGDHKPDVSKYFFPLIKELRKIHELGGFKIENVSSNIMFWPFITHCTCDLPAKAICQGLKQFNGQYGCGYCKHPGIPFRNKAKTATTYRYVYRNVNDELRTHTNAIATLQRMKNLSNSCVDGFRVVSPLIAVPKFDIIHGFTIDYMHCALLGVTSTLVSLWYDTKNKDATYYIRTKGKSDLNHRIISIKPPSVINRKPRSLSEKEHFKANEWRSFLLYYLTYSLGGILNKCYVEHFQLLSAATFILSKNQIHVAEIEKARQMLVRFANEYESLYGKTSVTMNIHLLRHLTDAVMNSGPLWSQSMFGFEQSNGDLVKSVKAYTNVLHQISEKYSMRCSLTAEKEPVDRLILSNAIKLKPSLGEKQIFEKYGIKFDGRLTFHKSIKIYGEMYTSLLYKKTKSIDYFIVFTDKQMGIIRYFVKFNESNYALVDLYDMIKENDHLQEVVPKRSMQLFDIAEIQEKLIYMEIGSRKIICNIPNNYEKT